MAHAEVRPLRQLKDLAQSGQQLLLYVVEDAGHTTTFILETGASHAASQARGFPHILYGVNVDDLGDYRPGQSAAKLHGVRFHGDPVRIEIAPEELPRALDPAMAARFVELFKPLGFHYVTLDLEGYRQGALNEALDLKRQ